MTVLTLLTGLLPMSAIAAMAEQAADGNIYVER